MIAPFKVAEARRFQRGGRRGAGRGAGRFARATSRAGAVSRPDRRTCQVIWSWMQAEDIASHGTSGMPVAIDMDGGVEDPDGNSWLFGASAPVVAGAPEAAFSQKPKAAAPSGTPTSPSAVPASLIGAGGSRPQPRSSEFSNGRSAPSEVLAKGLRVKPLTGGAPQVVSNAGAICTRDRQIDRPWRFRLDPVAEPALTPDNSSI